MQTVISWIFLFWNELVQTDSLLSRPSFLFPFSLLFFLLLLLLKGCSSHHSDLLEVESLFGGGRYVSLSSCACFSFWRSLTHERTNERQPDSTARSGCRSLGSAVASVPDSIYFGDSFLIRILRLRVFSSTTTKTKTETETETTATWTRSATRRLDSCSL